MKKITRIASLAAAAGLAIALSACSTGATSVPDAGSAEPQTGGTIVFGIDRDVATLDPSQSAITQQPTLAIANALFDPLMAYGENGSVEPYLAESFEAMDESQTRWLLTLHDGVTFSDGSPLDARAVVAHIERLSSEETGCSCRGDALKISAADVLSDTQVAFTLVAPNATFPKGFTRQLGFVASTTATDDFGFPLGSGPFEVANYASGNQILMTRNDNYWGEPAFADEVEFRILPDTDSRYQSLASGEVDIIWSENAAQYAQGESEGMPSSTATTGTSLGVFNTTKAPFDDADARKAVALAIDTDALIAVVNEGTGVAAVSPITSSSPYEVTVTQPEFDPEAAKALVAGLDAPLEFEYLTDGRPQSQARAVAIQQMLAEVGITMTIAAGDNAQFGTSLYTGDFTMIDFTTSIFGDTENSMASFFSSTGVANFSKFSDSTIDELAAEAAAEPDAEKRGELYNQMAAIAFENAPFTLYTENLDGFIYNGDRISGVPDVSTWSLISISPREFWVDTP